MLRGRRVFCTIFLLLVISCGLHLNINSVYGQTNPLSVTATVLPSTEWQKAIGQESSAKIESSTIDINQPVKIVINNKGFNQILLPNQNIQISIFHKNKLIQQQKITSNKEGTAGFVYIPISYGDYRIQFENVTYNQPIKLSSQLTFTINQSPLASLTSLINNLFGR